MKNQTLYMYSTTACVCSKNITDWPPSVQHRTYEPTKCHSTKQGNTL